MRMRCGFKRLLRVAALGRVGIIGFLSGEGALESTFLDS
jgi:hypothetical protein